MKVCFPVQTDQGIDSIVFNHFGSAVQFIIVDTVTNEVSVINNKDQGHAHGACNPLKALNNQKIDAVVVGGIGAGALSRLNQASIKVYRAGASTIRENLEMFLSGNLPQFALQSCCGGHGSAGGCAH